MNLTNSMRPAFSQRFNLMNAIRRVARENIYVSAANALIYQRVLVQKTFTQQFDYNHRVANMYTRPALDAYFSQKYIKFLSKGLCAQEQVDFNEACDQLKQYEKIYSLVEYCAKLHDGMIVLDRKIKSNNSNIPMNVYRQCKANSDANLFPEIEAYLQAYYDLMDDCKDFPIWKRKMEEDLGGSVSFLAIMMEEAVRNKHIKASAVYERFDMEKQVYFK